MVQRWWGEEVTKMLQAPIVSFEFDIFASRWLISYRGTMAGSMQHSLLDSGFLEAAGGPFRNRMVGFGPNLVGFFLMMAIASLHYILGLKQGKYVLSYRSSC